MSGPDFPSRKQSTARSMNRLGARLNKHNQQFQNQLACRDMMRQFVNEKNLGHHFTKSPDSPSRQ